MVFIQGLVNSLNTVSGIQKPRTIWILWFKLIWQQRVQPKFSNYKILKASRKIISECLSCKDCNVFNLGHQFYFLSDYGSALQMNYVERDFLFDWRIVMPSNWPGENGFRKFAHDMSCVLGKSWNVITFIGNLLKIVIMIFFVVSPSVIASMCFVYWRREIWLSDELSFRNNVPDKITVAPPLTNFYIRYTSALGSCR